MRVCTQYTEYHQLNTYLPKKKKIETSIELVAFEDRSLLHHPFENMPVFTIFINNRYLIQPEQ